MAKIGIMGRVRGLNPDNSAENREDEEFQLSPTGDCYSTFGIPEKAELVRLGNSWQCMCAAFTALTAVPTTAGKFTIWNGEPGNGNIYVIDSIALTKIIIDVTTNDYYGIFGQIIKPPMAAPTDAALAIVSLSGKKAYGGRARSVATSTTIANYWDNIGNSAVGAPAIAGSAWEQMDIDVFGKYIILPGAAFTLSVAEVTNTASTFRATIRWHEVQIPYAT